MQPKNFRVFLFLYLIIFLTGGISGQVEETPLELGKPLERELKRGGIHKYQFYVETKQFLYVVANQRGLDVILTLYSPDGAKVYEVDSPTGTNGPENLQYIAETTGKFTLEVKCLSRSQALEKPVYALTLNSIRTPTRQDDALRLVISALEVARSRSREGKYTESIAGYEQALELNKEANDISLGIQMLGELANTRARGGDIAGSIQSFLKSAEAAEANGISEPLPEIYRSVGKSYGTLGELPTGAKYFEKSGHIAESNGDKNGTAFAEWGVGVMYLLRSNYSLALVHFLKAEGLYKANGNLNALAAIRVNVGYVYGEQANNEQALRYFLEANERYIETEDANGLTQTYVNIGVTYALLDRFDDALQTLSKGLEIARKNNLNPGPFYTNLGSVYTDMGNVAKATEYYEMTKGDHANSLYNLAVLNYRNGNYEKTLEFAQQALDRIKAKRQTLIGYGQRDDFNKVWQSLYFVGRAQFRLGRFAEARRAFDEAIASTEMLSRETVGDEFQQQNSLGGYAKLYQQAVELVVSQGRYEDALRYAERSKSRVLGGILQGGRIDYKKVLSASERETERGLIQSLAAANSQLITLSQAQNKDSARKNELERELVNKRMSLEDFQTRLYSAHSELRIQRAEMKPLTVEEAGGLLADEKSALAEFVVGEEKTFLFLITKETKQSPVSLTVYSIDVTQKTLAKQTKNFSAKLTNGDPEFGKTSNELYQSLLGMSSEQLRGKTRLIVVPDGVLWNLPFQALRDANGKYLAEKMAVSYAPSLTALSEMQAKTRSRTRPKDTELFAFGNPLVAKATSERVQSVFMGEMLGPIPDAERLVNSLKQMYGPTRSKVYTGAAAREATAKLEAPKYRIVQFATHGILNNVSPMYSHLVLAQDEKDPNEDGLLEAWELKDLDLKADMVILSACDTARGRVSAGEGMIGMTWAAFIAGAPTTVASQWKVESSSTTELMLEFHRQLLSGKVSKAEALRRAQLKLMRIPKYKHPLYWAGWVIVGDGS